MTGFDTSTGVPAAWYPDPQGPPLLRWWDGSAWAPQTMDPRSAPAVTSPLVEPQVVPSAVTPVEPQPSSYVPMAGFPSTPARGTAYISTTHRTGSAQTTSIWFLALYPVIYVVVALIFGLIAAGLTGTVPQVAAGGASLIVTLFLCSSDSKTLKDRGYRAPGWGWGFIPLVYFILRVVRVGKDSLWPLLVWLGLQVALTVLVVISVLLPLILAGGFGGSGGPLSQTERAAQLTPNGMAEKLGADLTAAEYEVTSVTCPPLPSMVADTRVQCTVETPTTTMYVVVKVSPDEPGVAFVIDGGRIVEK